MLDSANSVCYNILMDSLAAQLVTIDKDLRFDRQHWIYVVRLPPYHLYYVGESCSVFKRLTDHDRLLRNFTRLLISVELCNKANSRARETEKVIDLQDQGYLAFKQLGLLIGMANSLSL